MLDQQSVVPDVGIDAAERPRHLIRGQFRKLTVMATSLFVVALGVVYVFAPTDPKLDMSLTELDSIPAFDVDLVAEYSMARDRATETIWGLIASPDGVPVTRAKLVLRGVSRKVRDRRAEIFIGGAKSFRSVVHLKPGRYRFTMTLRADGKPRSVSKIKRIRNHRYYGVGVLVRDGGIVTMVPIKIY